MLHRAVAIAIWSVLALPTAFAVPTSELYFGRGLYAAQVADGPVFQGPSGFQFFLATLVGENVAAAKLTFPSGSDVPLTSLFSGQRWAFEGSYLSKQGMDVSFPYGQYFVQYQTVAGQHTSSFTYDTDRYPGNVPYIVETGFSSLSSFDTRQAITLTFSDYSPPSNATLCNANFTLFDQSSPINTVFTSALSASCSPVSGLTVELPANTLQPGERYGYGLLYNASQALPVAGDVAGNGTIRFQLNTNGYFTSASAVPEVSPELLLIIGLATLALFKRRR